MRPVHVTDNLPPFCAVVTKSGNLNFLEPSGPLQVCNGTALPFVERLCMDVCIVLYKFNAPSIVHHNTVTLRITKSDKDKNATADNSTFSSESVTKD